MTEIFVVDLFTENGVNMKNKEAISKANIVYSKAYEDGHSGGFEEIANHFSDLMDFVKRLGANFS